MPFYVAIAGEKRGPYPAFRVIDLLRAGEVDPDALGWEQGMTAWIKLRDIPSFAEAIEVLEHSPASEEPGENEKSVPSANVPRKRVVPPQLPTVDGNSATTTGSARKEILGLSVFAEARPFTRFFARVYDYMLVLALPLLVMEVPPLPFTQGESVQFSEILAYFQNPKYQEVVQVQQIAFILWHAIEGVLLHYFGTTPGKAIFGIRVTNLEGGPLTLGQGFRRAMLVWLAGIGLGLPILDLIAVSVGFSMLLFTGSTLWDRRLSIKVHHLPLTPRRLLMAIGGYLLLMIVFSSTFS